MLAEAPKATRPVSNVCADISHSELFVDGEAYHDVVAVEFSTKHLLLCIPVRADHDAAVEKLTKAKQFRIVVKVQTASQPRTCSDVVDQTLSNIRFDRINYRCNTHHFVATPSTDRPSGIWIAELRFVAPLVAVDGDAEKA